jgi:hypothetical protein
MKQAVQHDDAIQVLTDSKTEDAPALSIVRFDLELGFPGD